MHVELGCIIFYYYCILEPITTVGKEYHNLWQRSSCPTKHHGRTKCTCTYVCTYVCMHVYVCVCNYAVWGSIGYYGVRDQRETHGVKLNDMGYAKQLLPK